LCRLWEENCPRNRFEGITISTLCRYKCKKCHDKVLKV